MFTGRIPCLYVSGWSYAYHYFGKFHIGLLALEIPREYYFVYSFWVLRSQVLWVAVLMIAAVLVSFRVRLVQMPLAGWVGTLAVVLLLWLSYQGGAATAMQDYQQDQSKDFPAHPRIRVWVDGAEGATAISEPREAMTDGCHRLLLQNESRAFVFRPRRDAPGAELSVKVIPMSDVAELRIFRNTRAAGDTCPECTGRGGGRPLTPYRRHL